VSNVDRWLLPDGIDEVLPERAHLVERMRREILDLYHKWGYDLVIPPMVEFTESLLSGSGKDLDLMTFRLTDQLSGRLMGVRADITPQVARMDAHSLNLNCPGRFCYAGTVLHTRPRGPLESRSPISVGVELFGEPSVSADIEIIELFLNTLSIVDIGDIYLDLGHVDIVRGLISEAQLSTDLETEIFELLQRKAGTELAIWISENIQDKRLSQWLNNLPQLAGSIEVLETAKMVLDGAPEIVTNAINQLEKIVESLDTSNLNIYLDLSEMPGYHYHTGAVFAAYIQGYGKALGNGGRYDHVGEAFGRARPATGFAFDLKALVSQSPLSEGKSLGIFAPFCSDPLRHEEVKSLRSAGFRVVEGFKNQVVDYLELKCDRELVKVDDKYVVQSLS
jgi:ATP phosphoribosyltransferase regulatory subunit